MTEHTRFRKNKRRRIIGRFRTLWHKNAGKKLQLKRTPTFPRIV